ncbi:hypothetical protein [Shewanella surugensis]|uniref:Uncharacterized protein n=1 Tax=Shewanella surugensis TaxID=212020 RepID=A0ABT0L5L1_9GAMM|nr:hypothetical protein [Shewanella surugensis]MCL1122978.1 hypothetical protein [Shewanella surugensis]
MGQTAPVGVRLKQTNREVVLMQLYRIGIIVVAAIIVNLVHWSYQEDYDFLSPEYLDTIFIMDDTEESH